MMNQSLKSKTIITFLSVTFFLLSTSIEVFAQNETNTEIKEYKGKILDNETKSTLASVNISVDGSNIGTVSNTEGDFSLKVPKTYLGKNIKISLLGYTNKTISLSQLEEGDNKIFLSKSTTKLAEVNIETIKDVEGIVRDVFKNKGDNYLDNHTIMTAFYRETIKQRKKNISLSEAVVDIYKTPYNSANKDVLKFYKTRKSTDYKRLDTLALKLQGGPFNTLFIDIIKYPEHIFTEASIPNYNFSFSHSTKADNKLIYVIDFIQKEGVKDPLYKGQLFIESENKILTSAVFSLNTDNKKEASNLFIKKKPSKAIVSPTKATYKVNYNVKNNKWYYAYGNLNLDFKVDWKNKLFNSNYSMSCEMAITDWKNNDTKEVPKFKERVKSSIIMSDYSIGFADPNFWGEHNIIEPDKSIEKAIKKIQKQL